MTVQETQVIDPDVLNLPRTISPVPTPRATPLVSRQIQSSGRDYSGRTFTKAEVQELIHTYSGQYGISPETPLCIAARESGYNQFSKNRSSSASGVFQYLSGTWAGTDEGKAGLPVYDADANVRAAIKYMASRHSTSPWSQTAVHCPPLTFTQ